MSTPDAGDRCGFEELSAGAAVNALEPEEDAALAEHLPNCLRCQEILRSSKEAASYLGSSVPQEDPPPQLRERILAEAARTPQQAAAVSQQEQDEPVGEVRRIEPRSRGKARMLLAAAAVVLLAVIGVLGVRVAQLSAERQEQAAQTQQMSRALQALSDQDASMTVLRTGEGRKVATLVSGMHAAAVVPATLRPNDARHIYVVWGMSADKPVAVATFRLSGDSVRALAWSTQAAKHQKYAISLEPGQVAPPAPSNVVAQGAKAA